MTWVGLESLPNSISKVKVLFDHRVLDILDIESLIFVAERMAALIETV
ncbi:MAG: hypothetical protein L3J03_08005 [Desulfobacterales bacterium]|nr:hypothetical protein [Desulfobacterales bacterium]